MRSKSAKTHLTRCTKMCSAISIVDAFKHYQEFIGSQGANEEFTLRGRTTKYWFVCAIVAKV